MVGAAALGRGGGREPKDMGDTFAPTGFSHPEVFIENSYDGAFK